MTNSDGGFQFDFQQPEKPVRPTVPPIPGQETAAYGAKPAAQDIPALQFRSLCGLCSLRSPHSLCSPRKQRMPHNPRKLCRPYKPLSRRSPSIRP